MLNMLFRSDDPPVLVPWLARPTSLEELAELESRERMSLRIEDNFVQRENIIRSEE